MSPNQKISKREKAETERKHKPSSKPNTKSRCLSRQQKEAISRDSSENNRTEI